MQRTAATGARVFAFVMAGGEGARLRPFTADCAKPALPFGGGYRVIDFVLSNLYNSGIPQACVLMQYRPLGLARYLALAWGEVRSEESAFVQSRMPGGSGAVDRRAGRLRHAGHRRRKAADRGAARRQARGKQP